MENSSSVMERAILCASTQSFCYWFFLQYILKSNNLGKNSVTDAFLTFDV